MAKPTDVLTATMTRQEWSEITASLSYDKRLLYRKALAKLMSQIDK